MKRKPSMGQRVCDYLAETMLRRSRRTGIFSQRTPLGLGMRRLQAEPLEERRLLSASTYVDGSLLTFDTIQDAINAAQAGGTVTVTPGVYAENLTVDKIGLTLEGSTQTPGDVVVDPLDGDGITLTVGGVTIRNLKVNDAFHGITGEDFSGTSTFENVEVTDSTITGIVLMNVGEVTFNNITVTGNNWYGIDCEYIDGSVTMTSVNVSGNSDENLRLNEVGPVTITDSQFCDSLEFDGDGNIVYGGRGMNIYSLADITLTNVIADGNYATNLLVDTAGTVTVVGGSFSNSVCDHGMDIDIEVGSDGAVSLSGVTADANGFMNLRVVSGTTITITDSSFDNAYYGMTLSSNNAGACLLSGVTADANIYYNLGVGIVGSLTVENSLFRDSSDGQGISVSMPSGDLTFTNVVADGNFYQNLSLLAAASVTITDSSFSGSLGEKGIELLGVDGAVQMTNVTADNNFAENVWIDRAEMFLIDPETGWPVFDPETGDFVWVVAYPDTATITGGSFSGSGANVGLKLTSVDTAVVTGATINGNATGVYVGPGAAAKISGNSIVGNGASVGVDVEGATVLLEANDLTNGLIGLLVRPDGMSNNAVVDAGQLADGVDFTGLGVSLGGNDFSTYTASDASSGAVVNLNADAVPGPQGAPADVTALGNTWYSADPLAIEAAVYHDPDDPALALGMVDYAVLSNLAVGTTVESGVTTLSGSFANDPQVHQVLIDWGDNTSDLIDPVASGVWSFDVDHVYQGGGGGAINLDDATFQVEENTVNATTVGAVSATGGGNPSISVLVTDSQGDTLEAVIPGSGGGTFTYSIVGGTGQTAFAIDPATGEITVADQSQLDFEFTGSYTLEVQVTDGSAVDTAVVTVELVNRPSVTGAVFVDVNENGQYDANEPTIDNVTIQLLDASGAPVLDGAGNPVTATSLDGYYLFEDLPAGTYQLHELQPTGVNDGAELLGTLGGTVVANDTVQLILATTDAHDYLFAEIGQEVTSGDTANTGFWNSRRGRDLMVQGGTALADWLSTNFANVFGDELVGATGQDVARFYQTEIFRHRSLLSLLTAKVDIEFMALTLATYFTNSNLAGEAAEAYGFNVTDTGIGTSVINVGISGAAFGVANNTDMTIMQMLLGTNALTDSPNHQTGYANVYDTNGDGRVSVSEAILRVLAHDVYSDIIRDGN